MELWEVGHFLYLYLCSLEFVSSNHNSALRWQRPHLKADLFFRRAPRARTRPHVLCTNVSWISGPRHPLWNKWPYKAIGREGFDWADRSINARNVSHRWPRRTSQPPQQSNTPNQPTIPSDQWEHSRKLEEDLLFYTYFHLWPRRTSQLPQQREERYIFQSWPLTLVCARGWDFLSFLSLFLKPS